MSAEAPAVVRESRTTDDRTVKESLTVQADLALAAWLASPLGAETLAELAAWGIEPCLACNLPVRFGEASGPFHDDVCCETHRARLGRGAEREAAHRRAMEKRRLRQLGLPIPAALNPRQEQE